jgi:hypothetical protein
MMSENPGTMDRSKHIDYRVHALRERIQDGVVRLVDCESEDMLADVLTKNLPSPAFIRHRTVMSGLAPHTSPSLRNEAIQNHTCSRMKRLTNESVREAHSKSRHEARYFQNYLAIVEKTKS